MRVALIITQRLATVNEGENGVNGKTGVRSAKFEIGSVGQGKHCLDFVFLRCVLRS